MMTVTKQARQATVPYMLHLPLQGPGTSTFVPGPSKTYICNQAQSWGPRQSSWTPCHARWTEGRTQECRGCKIRVRSDIIRNARIKLVGKCQSRIVGGPCTIKNMHLGEGVLRLDTGERHPDVGGGGECPLAFAGGQRASRLAWLCRSIASASAAARRSLSDTRRKPTLFSTSLLLGKGPLCVVKGASASLFTRPDSISTVH